MRIMALFILAVCGAVIFGGCGGQDAKKSGISPQGTPAAVTQVAEAEHDITFGTDCFAGEGAGMIKERSARNFIKISADEGRDFVYKDGIAVAGEAYLFSGTMWMSYCHEDAVSEIVLKASEDRFVRYFLRYNSSSSYSLISQICDGEESSYKLLAERDSGTMNFLVLWTDKSAYLYLDNVFTERTDANFASVHAGFGGSGCRLEIQNLSLGENAETIQKLLDDLHKPFGRHVTGDADYYESIFFKTGENEYEKRSYHYLQTFFYIDGKPAAGDYYWVDGILEMENADPNGQVALMICQDENNKTRFVLEQNANGTYHIFSDRRVNGAFTGYTEVALTEKTIAFTLEYDHGTANLYLDGKLCASVAFELGVAHFGIGGDRCQFAVRDLVGGFERL